MNISFSVIIVTYNRNKLLERSLKSVLKQSLQPKEIIIVNNYHKPLKNKFKSSKIKIIESIKNFDSADGRNIGSITDSSKYLAFLDDDDYWHKDYLKISKKYILNKFPDILIANKIYFDDGKYKIFKKINKINLNECFMKNPGILGSNIIIKKKTLYKLNGFDQNLIPSEDKSLIIDAHLSKKKIIIQNNYILYKNNNKNKLSNDYRKLQKGKINFIKKYSKNMNFKSKINIYKNILIYKLKLILF